MARLAPAGPVYQAGTLSGNPVAVAAGLATLRSADADVYAALDANARTDRRPGRRRADRGRRGAPGAVRRQPVLGVLRRRRRCATSPAPRPPRRSGTRPFFHAMLDAGVYLPPSAFEAWFVNAAMDDAVFERSRPRCRPPPGRRQPHSRRAERRQPNGRASTAAKRSNAAWSPSALISRLAGRFHSQASRSRAGAETQNLGAPSGTGRSTGAAA